MMAYFVYPLIFSLMLAALIISAVFTLKDWEEWANERVRLPERLRHYWPPYYSRSNIVRFLDPIVNKIRTRFITSSVGVVICMLKRVVNLGRVARMYEIRCERDIPHRGKLSRMNDVLNLLWETIQHHDCRMCGEPRLGVWLRVKSDDQGRPLSNLLLRFYCLDCVVNLPPEDRGRFNISWVPMAVCKEVQQKAVADSEDLLRHMTHATNPAVSPTTIEEYIETLRAYHDEAFAADLEDPCDYESLRNDDDDES